MNATQTHELAFQPGRLGDRIAAATLVLTFTSLLATIVLGGCEGPFTPASYVEKPRVVGAAVSVAAEPGRAWVKPGEPATVTWLTVARQDPTPLEWSFILCLGANGACAGAPLSTFRGQGTTASVTFTTPDGGALGSTLSPILVGAICADGDLSIDAATLTPTCRGMGASGTDTLFVVPVQRGDETDHHPVLGDDRLQLGGADWLATTAGEPGNPCDASAGLPMVAVGAGKQTIRLISDPNDRETYLAGDPAVARLEELQISQFTTAGKLKFSYSSIPATDVRPDADVEISWEPPVATEIPAAGMVVQFHFVVRDLRGGIDWTHRALCLKAP